MSVLIINCNVMFKFRRLEIGDWQLAKHTNQPAASSQLPVACMK